MQFTFSLFSERAVYKRFIYPSPHCYAMAKGPPAGNPKKCVIFLNPFAVRVKAVLVGTTFIRSSFLPKTKSPHNVTARCSFLRSAHTGHVPSRNIASSVEPKALLTINSYEQTHTGYDTLRHVVSPIYDGGVRRRIDCCSMQNWRMTLLPSASNLLRLCVIVVIANLLSNRIQRIKFIFLFL